MAESPWHKNGAIHRDLFKGARGEDVQQCQRRINDQVAPRNRIGTDGWYGNESIERAKALLYKRGWPENGQARHPLPEVFQKYIRDPDKRPQDWKERERQRAQDNEDKVVVQAGSPHWGGCEDIIKNEVVPIASAAGIAATSGKRSETFGNPSSDHYIGNTTASARDFATSENHALLDKIAQKVVGRSVSDYENVHFQRAGRTFRFQGIAGTHGTGPHLHIGIRLV